MLRPMCEQPGSTCRDVWLSGRLVYGNFELLVVSSLRLFWDGITHPRWTFGTFLRTIFRHGVPYFENSQAERGAPIIARNVDRDFTARDAFNWAELEKVRRRWKGRIILKGLMSPEDAKIARSAGVEGIIVSNHGGRQLDGTVSPMRVLPGIVEAAGDGITVMMDSGIRRGTDVLKALALGAEFVFVGRPFNYAATIAGEQGVAHAVAILKGEVRRNMAQLGVTSVAQLGPQYLSR